MKIGKYSLHPILTGRFKLDGGAMFGVVPKVLWQRTNPSDNNNRIDMVMRSLLLRSNERNILIDNGLGDFRDEKFCKMYDVSEVFSVPSALSTLNLTPADITDVIISHLHFDHAGGSVSLSNDNFTPAFPNASYHCQTSNLEWAKNPNKREKGSYLPEYIETIEKHNKFVLHRGTASLDEFVSLIPTYGHTVGHQIIKISDTNTSLFYCADLIPLASHIRIPYVMAYDLFPLQTMREKEALLEDAVNNNSILFFEHDPEITACSVKKGQKDFEIKDKVTF